MDRTVNGPRQQANLFIEDVWYNGEDDLLEGEAVCYDTDYGTAVEFDGRRHNRVDRPNLTNNKDFAGVAIADYSGKTKGRRIRIAVPGSKGAMLALGEDVVLDQAGVLTFAAGASGSHRGRWHSGLAEGRGAAKIRQTVTALIEAGMDGTWSLAADGVTLTMADNDGLSVGDTVVLVGGADDGTGAIVPGKYAIASVDAGGTDVVLAASAVTATPAGALACTGYAYTGNPKAQANLQEGAECGGAEFISVPDAGDADQAYMVGGLSYICGGIDIAANGVIQFAQGTTPGEEKVFLGLGAIATSAVVIDFDTSGLQIDRATALTEVQDVDGADSAVYLKFGGLTWYLEDAAGVTLSAV